MKLSTYLKTFPAPNLEGKPSSEDLINLGLLLKRLTPPNTPWEHLLQKHKESKTDLYNASLAYIKDPRTLKYFEELLSRLWGRKAC